MTKKLYKLMNWARIEGVVYSEEDNPHEFLGLTKTLGGYLIQGFFPTAKKAYAVVKAGKDVKEYPMELADEEGFYAVFISKLTGVDKVSYHFRIVDEKGVIKEVEDPYSFKPSIDETVLKKFKAGICYDIYKYLGAHEKSVNRVKGVSFAVWAPNAIRVSVVGDFNNWDGRINQMRRLGDSGVFEIFIPGVKANDAYKYEIKYKGSVIALKSDPYGFSAMLRPENASVVADMKFDFTDSKWVEERKCPKGDKPMAIYQVNLASFRKNDEDVFPNYRDIAKELCAYVKETGYTHIELMPVMEYPLDESFGLQTIGYYSVTSRFGSPADFKYFMNYMHENGIYVILDWNPASFPRDDHGLSYFDGTYLYEHQNPKQGLTADGTMCLYNYARPEVSNYLISSALFWINEYHADGIRVNGVGQMLYLDYGKSEGEYVANIYGGNENLDGLEMLKHLNSINGKANTGAMIIADGRCDFPKLTEKLSKDGVGFSYKWNQGFINDLSDFMYLDPYFRGAHYDELTVSMLYAYSENYILPMSHENALNAGGTVINRLPGTDDKKKANLHLMLGYMFAHPGKKLVYMDHKFDEVNSESVEYIKDLLKLYKQCSALYELDESPDGFEWINNISADENIIAFLRKNKAGDNMLIVCNFADVAYEKHMLGVPFAGKYKEVFNSDNEKYGGTSCINKRVKTSKDIVCDARENSIKINIPPLGISIFNCICG